MNSHLWQKIWQLDGFLNEKWYCKTKSISSYSMAHTLHRLDCSISSSAVHEELISLLKHFSLYSPLQNPSVQQQLPSPASAMPF